MAIIRSRNASPGLTVTRTMIQSDNTRVPPVTALKSPPDSRMTGADSPVIADSSTEATPSMTSPSAGTTSLASIKMISPLRKVDPLTNICDALRLAFVNFFARTSCFAPRRDSAWALLRPSASASAKLAKRTVNHSHKLTARMNPAGASPLLT